ncbi:hypothetical protein [Micromonospora auratinigra]|uniref:Tat (Twin-arginine translocation) pathway signal sequence n=1 Tax=Micromonospora auratinigra TaxID=261654 RepID=A0A1A8ZY63_9ACTN|nr:hypothetical protein [Micromonospora auratinigra]SBT49087.1 hypothetical protein GA0070611_4286 [Micromonospora auratinigra]
MDRRALLRGIAGAAVAAPAAGLLGASPAEAATYYVMATEQAGGRILRFNPAAWSGGTTLWQAPSRTGTWTNLSDVKRRGTARWGNVMLVTSSGAGDYLGRAAMIDESAISSSHTGGIVWQTTVDGNPHSIERIEGRGAIVVATSKGATGSASGGGLHLYVPSSNGGTPSTHRAQFISFPGAHGVIYNTNGFVIAVGSGEVRLYSLTGDGSSTRLKYRTKLTFSDGAGRAKTGHDILPDHKGSGYFFTSSYNVRSLSLVYAGSSWQMTSNVVSTADHVKAYTRLPNGVRTWVVPGSGEGEWSRTIHFSSGNHSKSGARFYRVRYYTTAFG